MHAWQYGDIVDIIVFSCLKFRFCLNTLSIIMFIIYSGALGCNVIGVYCWIFPKD